MPNYVYFLLAVAGLIVGYIIYCSIVAKIFGADENRPPRQDHGRRRRLR